MSSPAQILDIQPVPSPRAPGLVVTPRASIGVVFDNNVIVATEGSPTPNDTVLRATPGLDVALTKKHTALDLSYSGAIARYRKQGVYDSFDQTARAEFRHQASRRVQLFARDMFSVDPATDAVLEADVPFLRTGTRQNTFELGTGVTATRRLNLSSSYQFQWLEFDRTGQPVDLLLQGGSAHTLAFGARQHVSEHIAIGGDGRVQHAIIHDGADTSDIQSAEAVVAWQVSPTVQVEGGVGLAHVSLGGEFGSHTAPAGHISITKRTEYAFFTAGAAQSFRPSFGTGRSTKNQQVTLGAFVPFAARRSFVNGQLMWQQNGGVLDEGLSLSALWVHMSTGYAFSRWFRVEGFYQGTFQDTNVVGGTVRRNRVGVQIVTSAPMRID